MRRWILIFSFWIAVLGSLLYFIHSISRPKPSEIGDARLEIIFQLARKNGREAQLKSSDLILINFWASWCAPCLQETPSLIRFAKAHKPKLSFISISQDTVTKDYLAFLKVLPALEDASEVLVRDQDQSLGRLFGVDKLPDTFIYSLKAKRYFRMSGSYDWDRPETMSQIEKELVPK